MQFKPLGIVLMLWSCLLAISGLTAQITIKGTVQDAATGTPISGVRLSSEGGNLGVLSETYSQEDGSFELSGLLPGTYQFEAFKEIYIRMRMPLTLTEGEDMVILPPLRLVLDREKDMLTNEDLIPTISIPDNETDVTAAGAGQNVSGILTASRDVFVSTASFVFGPMRFRMRGYDNDHTAIFMNGIPMNDLETGRPQWSAWGGLNDVIRDRNITVGVQATDMAFGGIGGATSIDTRASVQRAGTRVSYANSNRSYRHRIMATHATGEMANGWSFAASASWRYAGEGYVEGTSFNGASYFLSADKRLNKRHLLSFTFFGSPTVRGASNAAQTELHELTGNNFYNSLWGFQTLPNGEQVKRNARMSTLHQPLAVLSHEWKIDETSSLITAAGFRFGRYGRTGLDWYNATDPRPDYYRKLPSFFAESDPVAAARIAEQFANDPTVAQIHWDRLYQVNVNNIETINNANGSGQALTGRRSLYIIEEQRNDVREFNFNSVYEKRFGDYVELRAGLTYQYAINHQYKVVDDLLGGEFYLDIDRFAERDSGIGSDFAQNDVTRPNATIGEGDVFGYNYKLHLSKGQAWTQARLAYEHFEAFLGAELSNTQFWREGLLQNGKFENSIGRAETQNFWNYALKAGATYKIDGRNYFYTSGMYQTRAPFTRNAYTSPRTRDEAVVGLRSETIYGIEGGYLLKAPKYKARLTGYYTRFDNQTTVRSLFLDNAFQAEDGTIQAGFVNYIMTGINKQHAGLEAAAELRLPKGFSVHGVAALGQHIYVSRPDITVQLDNSPEATVSQRRAYIQNFRVASGPQTALNLGLNYNSPKFWFINLNFNYFMDNWIDINPERRTVQGVAYVNNPAFQEEIIDRNSELWNRVVAQERAAPGMTVDLFAGKSWLIKRDAKRYFLNLNVGINNLLNNVNLVGSGFEQLRFDYRTKDVDRFPTRYFYNFGTNYFAGLTLRF